MERIKELQEVSKNFNVLYVEDDLDIQNSVSKYLKKIFKSIECANNGLEALDKYKKDMYDIVITDISMPKMDGIEMIEEIVKINNEQEILVTTAHNELNYLHSSINLGVNGYVIKPYDYDVLNHELYKISKKINKFKENENFKQHLDDMVKQKTSELESLIEFQSDNYDKTLYSMVELIERRDTYTAGHSKRVAHYSELIARDMGYPENDCKLLHQAAVLHDVGKISTPDAILLNPNTLNDIEYKLIQEHVEVSYRLLKKIPMFESLCEIVYSHHERYDGNGYPRKLKKDEIHPMAHILIIADAFDSMTTNRIYKSRKTVSQALDEIKALSAKQFHPGVVEYAIDTLKDIIIDENINQLPKTRLEEERFAYFYKDRLSSIYNHHYLDIVLMKNERDNAFEHLYIIKLQKFSKYNNEYGWKAGDKLLGEIGNYLHDSVDEALIFRVFGDDFVIICDCEIDIKSITKGIEDILENIYVVFFTKHIRLKTKKITKVSQLEKI
ncbi:MAG: response regulator [Thiovulaceae bacterium]|nr:response regulator [Sulfurimonadaceae bacterium]